MKYSVATILFLFLLTACENRDSRVLEIDRNAGLINFTEIVPEDWDKVCLFGPYSNNKTAHDLLGFSWELEEESRIYSLDGITLFVFVKNNDVQKFHEVPRWADFSHLSGNCYARSNSKFNVKPNGAVHVPNDV